MLIIKHSIQTTAPAWAVWKVLSDVSSWPAWDSATEYSSINGPFATGTTGELKPKGGPVLQTKLTKVEPMKMFVQEAKLTLARVVMSHFLTETDGNVTVTFQTELHGPLAFVWALLIGRDIKRKIPIEMSAMLKIAEQLSNANDRT
jgi:hypothetical protein